MHRSVIRKYYKRILLHCSNTNETLFQFLFPFFFNNKFYCQMCKIVSFYFIYISLNFIIILKQQLFKFETCFTECVFRLKFCIKVTYFREIDVLAGSSHFIHDYSAVILNIFILYAKMLGYSL